LYAGNSRMIQVVAGLPQTPKLVYEFDTARIPGSPADLAVSDDGAAVLTRTIDGDRSALWVIDSTGTSSQLPLDQPAAIAFFENRQDAIVIDNASHSAVI